MTWQSMRQGDDERVRTFGARLRRQTSVCKFTQQCPTCEANVDYTEAMIKDVLWRGLEDSEVQMGLLGNRNQDMTLEQVLGFFEAKEAGKRSASCLLLPQVPQATDAVTGSTYRKQKKAPPKDLEICTYHGTKGHGRNPQQKLRGRNVQPLAPSAITVTRTTIFKRCEEESLEQSQLRILSIRAGYPIHFVKTSQGPHLKRPKYSHQDD